MKERKYIQKRQYRKCLIFIISFYIFVRTSTISRQSSRSPVLTRRPHQQIKQLVDTDFDTTLSAFQPRVLLSLDINETMVPVINKIDKQLFGESQIIDSLPFSSFRLASLSSKTNSLKRPLESSSSEQIIIKRRYQKIAPSKSFSNYFLTLYYICVFFFLFRSDYNSRLFLYIIPEEYITMYWLPSNQSIRFINAIC